MDNRMENRTGPSGVASFEQQSWSIPNRASGEAIPRLFNIYGLISPTIVLISPPHGHLCPQKNQIRSRTGLAQRSFWAWRSSALLPATSQIRTSDFLGRPLPWTLTAVSPKSHASQPVPQRTSRPVHEQTSRMSPGERASPRPLSWPFSINRPASPSMRSLSAPFSQPSVSLAKGQLVSPIENLCTYSFRRSPPMGQSVPPCTADKLVCRTIERHHVV